MDDLDRLFDKYITPDPTEYASDQLGMAGELLGRAKQLPLGYALIRAIDLDDAEMLLRPPSGWYWTLVRNDG